MKLYYRKPECKEDYDRDYYDECRRDKERDEKCHCEKCENDEHKYARCCPKSPCP